MATVLKVLIVARPGDSHADFVEEALLRRSVPVFRISLNTLHATVWVWSPAGCLNFLGGGSWWSVESGTAVWWRRAGQAETDDLEQEEAELVRAELWQLLRGALVGSNARLIDDPGKVELAENKLYQLKVANDLLIDAPETLVTNHVEAAQDFLRKGPIIAKAVSCGAGLAPYAQEVPQGLLSLLRRAPTLLQCAVNAEADLRLVTVGKKVFSWKRCRNSEEPLDWRLSDPSGEGFFFTDTDNELRVLALRLADALGLSTSVQDWLLANKRYIFLEVNPQGQWAFLRGSRSVILPAFVEHLVCGV